MVGDLAGLIADILEKRQEYNRIRGKGYYSTDEDAYVQLKHLENKLIEEISTRIERSKHGF